MRTHFIAIGGAAMHNLALALHSKGYQVTGSDDAIFEPSKSRLEKKGYYLLNLAGSLKKSPPIFKPLFSECTPKLTILNY